MMVQGWSMRRFHASQRTGSGRATFDQTVVARQELYIYLQNKA